MIAHNNEVSTSPSTKVLVKDTASLSDYYPSGTQYFYGYPLGDDSGFLNKAKPESEELVAARACVCAGPRVTPVTYFATSKGHIGERIYRELGLPNSEKHSALVFSQAINSNLVGDERNHAIKNELRARVNTGCLVMAQPYTQKDMTDLFQIHPEISTRLNDKKHMSDYIPSHLLPRRYGSFINGQELYNAFRSIPYPCVIKVSSSSAGDGVYICKNSREIQDTIDIIQHIKGSIIIEEYIYVKKNYAVHFGIPHNTSEKIDILGINEQITSPKGEFMGGIIRSKKIPKDIAPTVETIKNDILPLVRNMGWYGVGGFDVLIDINNKAYLIDCNFRMTGMSAYHFMLKNKQLTAPFITLSGSFKGTEEELLRSFSHFYNYSSERRFLQLITLSKKDNEWHFNASLSYKDREQLLERTRLILNTGIQSATLLHIDQV